MTSYPLQGRMWYVRGPTFATAARRAARVSTKLAAKGWTTEAAHIYYTDNHPDPWVGVVLLQNPNQLEVVMDK